MPKSDNYVNIDIIEPIVIFIKNFKMAVKMAKQKNKFVVRKKIWLKDSIGKVAFGLGRFRILAAIERLGSMNSAATDFQ